MVLWNVKLFDRVLVTVTERETAEKLVALLNSGALYGVPGDAAAYEDARGMRAPTTEAATVSLEQTGPGDPIGQLGAVGESGCGCAIADDKPVLRTTRRRHEPT